MSIFGRTIDRVGNWNPQLLRELKARADLPGIFVAISISLTAQLLTLYLTQEPLKAIEWLDREIWWGLAIGGTYLLARDFRQELRAGTLKLVELSPTSPRKIIIGKLLGVPILIYLAVLLAMPLYLFAMAQTSGISWSFFLEKMMAAIVLLFAFLFAILSAIEFKIMPLFHSIILAILARAVLMAVSIAPIVSLSQNANWRYVDIIASSISMAIISFATLNFVESLYRSLQSWQEQNLSFGNFIVSSIFLAAYICMVGLMPVPTLSAILLIWFLSTTDPSDRADRS